MKIFPKPKKVIYSDSKLCTNKITKGVCGFDENEVENALSNLSFSADGVTLDVIKNDTLKKEEYHINIEENKIEMEASTKYGVNYAALTLKQILSETKIPCMRIEDEPDFEIRCVMLDVSRSKIPKPETIKKTIDLLADMKFNQIQLYFEGIIFEYEGYEEYLKDKNPVTREYIRTVKEHCKKRYIDLAPNHNSFGHMDRWLTQDSLNSLAECPEGFDRTDEFNITMHWNPGVLNPLDPKSIEFVDSLYAQVMPEFESEYLHVGGDEAFELGKGASKEKTEKEGKGKVYADYMIQLNDLCKKYGVKMVYWGDMVLESPEAVALMPKDSIPCIWGYEQEHPFEEQCKIISDGGFDFFVSPGTSAWGSMLGRSDNMVTNQKNAAIYGNKYGAKGYLLTDWGQEGHVQFDVISYVPFAYGAGLAWGLDENIENSFEYLDKNIFKENGFSKYLFDCGNYYKEEAYKRFNTTALMSVVTTPFENNCYMYDQTGKMFKNIAKLTADKIEELDNFKSCPNGFKEEILMNLKLANALARLTVIKLRTTCDSAEADAIINEFEELFAEYKTKWNERNFAYNCNCFVDFMKERLNELKQMVNEKNII